MKDLRPIRSWRPAWFLALLCLLIVPVGLTACGDEESNNENLFESSNEDNRNQSDNQRNQDSEYEAGLLDGYWELEWSDGEHFSSFSIEHNLDEDSLSATFDTVGGDSGTVRTIDFEEDVEPDENRTPGRMTGEWSPFPNNQNSNEEYTITAAYFAEGDDDKMVGEISAAVDFDVQMFEMVRVEPPEADGEGGDGE